MTVETPEEDNQVLDSSETEQVDVLDMSDEDFLQMELPVDAPSEEGEQPEETAVEESDTEEETDSEESPEQEEKPEEKGAESEEGEQEKVPDEPDTGGKTEAAKSGVNYQSEHEKLLAPFKANGRDMQIDSVDEARTLMQMGANYNKKMAGLKPHLRIVKMLENHNLLDEEKLNYLIDIDKKNPQAIQKMISDSGIDPLDLNDDSAEEYKPQSYRVDDKSMALDEALSAIRDSNAYQTTVGIVSEKWDERSREVIIDNPQVIGLINSHVENGIYEKIQTEIDKQRMFGRLTGLSDLEAYKQVGDEIQARGGFTDPTGQQEAPAKANEQEEPPVPTKADPKIIERKRAAAPTRSAPSGSKKPAEFNPLNMSDEEFEKVGLSKFL